MSTPNRDVPAGESFHHEWQETDSQTLHGKPMTESEGGTDAALCALVRHFLGSSRATLSSLAKYRESFGLAWLVLVLFTKMRKIGKNCPHPPRSIDLSEASGLSPKKMFWLLLNFLPPSVEELKLDDGAMKGPALALFLSFLEENLQREKKGRQRIFKSFIFAEDFLDAGVSHKIFPLLLPSLESLSLRGNHLRTGGCIALADAILAGKADCLRTLDLGSTEPTTKGMKRLFEAIKERPLNFLQTLALSGVCLSVSGRFQVLVGVLSRAALSHLRSLLLRSCGLCNRELSELAEVLGKGELPLLETLDLEGNSNFGIFDSGWLTSFAECLCSGKIPRLKTLNLPEFGNRLFPNPVTAFLTVLKSPECPLESSHFALRVENDEVVSALATGSFPNIRSLSLSVSVSRAAMRALFSGCFPNLHTLQLHLRTDTDDPAALASLFFSGQFPKLRTLSLHAEGWRALGAFLTALMDAPAEPQFEALCLKRRGARTSRVEHGEVLRLLGGAIRRGRLGSLHDLELYASRHEMDVDVESKRELFQAISGTKLRSLSRLKIQFPLEDAEMILLAEAVRRGNLCGLECLDLGHSRHGFGIGKVGMEALMGAIAESDVGLPFLENLNMSNTFAGEGGGSLGRVLMSEKVPRLSVIDLQRSGLTDEAMGGLGEAVRSGAMRKVSSLKLSSDRVSPEGWHEFISAFVRSHHNLPSIDVEWFYWLNPDRSRTELIFEALSLGKFPAESSLCSMEYHQNKIGPLVLDEKGVEVLSDRVRRGKESWSRFRLSDGVEGGVNVDSLIIAIAESELGLPPDVETLDLKGGRVGLEALRVLAETRGGHLGKLPDLRHLSLSDCEIDNEKLTELAKVFSRHKLPNLQSLDLSKNRISTKGVSKFIDSLSRKAFPKLSAIQFGEQMGFEGEEGRRGFSATLGALQCLARCKGKLLRVSLQN
uniref:Uncharacterized protein n=1 Tax=Chromera velia CCMP2878 TaxID=1169474 RepID=A0A0G4HNA2_9ALVE|eukprot:Cvel_7662.t1-p1 / transcript=Cvel_7662.t1 / gene=Cvel_7662 / organism=Chromera_velia_CCMP2878 / gene_product=hypothetical protein / transcript_product=hypothetical protein / location=Cvel_scaffold406:31390-36730(+) / protein_length=939 / sequence_SO=supercontig / SO=protein_coding / is_pseudo=false